MPKNKANKAKKEAADKKLKEAREAAEKAEKEAKEAAETEDEAGDDGGGDGSDGGHDDAAQDKVLIKKMLDEYVGKTDDMDKGDKEKLEKMAMEAYQAHKEMGAKEDEAYQHAGMALKLARHMAAKQTEAEESEDEGGKDRNVGDPETKESKEDESECGTKESDRVKKLETELLETRGRLASLESQSKKTELEQHVEKKLKESGQPRSITTRFREAAGEFRSIKDFDSKWAIFLEGVKNTGGSMAAIDWTPVAEKSVLRENEDGKVTDGKNLDFSDCAEE